MSQWKRSLWGAGVYREKLKELWKNSTGFVKSCLSVALVKLGERDDAFYGSVIHDLTHSEDFSNEVPVFDLLQALVFTYRPSETIIVHVERLLNSPRHLERLQAVRVCFAHGFRTASLLKMLFFAAATLISRGFRGIRAPMLAFLSQVVRERDLTLSAIALEMTQTMKNTLVSVSPTPRMSPSALMLFSDITQQLDHILQSNNFEAAFAAASMLNYLHFMTPTLIHVIGGNCLILQSFGLYAPQDDVLTFFVEHLTHADPEIRHSAMASLSELKDNIPAFTRVLRHKLYQSEDVIQCQYLTEVMRSGEDSLEIAPQNVPYSITLSQSPDRNVRRIGYRALLRLSVISSHAAEAFLKGIQDPYLGIRADCALLLCGQASNSNEYWYPTVQELMDEEENWPLRSALVCLTYFLHMHWSWWGFCIDEPLVDVLSYFPH